MAIPDAEMARRCREAFGTPLDEATREAIAAALGSLAGSADRVRGAVAPASEPGGHAALFREARRGG